MTFLGFPESKEQHIKLLFGRIRNEKRFSGKCLPNLASRHDDDDDEYGDYDFGPSQVQAQVLRYTQHHSYKPACVRARARIHTHTHAQTPTHTHTHTHTQLTQTVTQAHVRMDLHELQSQYDFTLSLYMCTCVCMICMLCTMVSFETMHQDKTTRFYLLNFEPDIGNTPGKSFLLLALGNLKRCLL